MRQLSIACQFSRSYGNSRTTSNIRKRRSPDGADFEVTRFFSTSEVMLSMTDLAGRLAGSALSQRASAASSVKPPANTESRQRLLFFVIVQQIKAPFDSSTHRPLPVRKITRPACQKRQPAPSFLTMSSGKVSLYAAASSIASGNPSSSEHIPRSNPHLQAAAQIPGLRALLGQRRVLSILSINSFNVIICFLSQRIFRRRCQRLYWKLDLAAKIQ